MKKLNISLSSDSEILTNTVNKLSSEFKFRRPEPKNALSVLLLNLYYEDKVLTTRAKNSFGSSRYNPNSIGTLSHIRSLNKLAEHHYIVQTIGSIKGGERLTTTISRTKKLESLFVEQGWYTNNQINNYKTELTTQTQSPETIVLREKVNGKKKLVDYDDTDKTNAMRKDMQRYYELINSWEVSVPSYDDLEYSYFYEAEPIKRLFTMINGESNSFQYGGRIYASWCDLSKEMRALIQIDGEETIEHDFQASSINTVYIYKTGNTYQGGDPYVLVINGITIPRSLVKQISTMIFFNTSIRGLSLALERYYRGLNDEEQKVSDYKSTLTKFTINEIVTAYNDKHKLINDYFLKDKKTGSYVQFLESERTMDIINELTKLGIPVLTVYDSFIVQTKHEDILLRFMS